MGKRKSTKSKAAPKKKAPKLETTFSCPFCNHADTVECSINLKLLLAIASCRICEESFCTKAHALTEPIDVYGEWIDECDRVNKGVDARDLYDDLDDDEED